MSERIPGPRRLALWKPSGVKLQLLSKLCHRDLSLGTLTGSSSRAWPAQGPGRSPSPPWPVYSTVDRGQAGASPNGSGKEDCQGHSRELRASSGAAGQRGSWGPRMAVWGQWQEGRGRGLGLPGGLLFPRVEVRVGEGTDSERWSIRGLLDCLLPSGNFLYVRGRSSSTSRPPSLQRQHRT